MNFVRLERQKDDDEVLLQRVENFWKTEFTDTISRSRVAKSVEDEKAYSDRAFLAVWKRDRELLRPSPCKAMKVKLVGFIVCPNHLQSITYFRTYFRT